MTRIDSFAGEERSTNSRFRTACRRQRRWSFLVSPLPFLLVACAVEPTLVGFPPREIENKGEEAKALLGDIAKIEAAVEKAGEMLRRAI